MATIKITKEEIFETEVNRIAGEIALKSPEQDTAKAQEYFERALAVARQQQAKSWELRAAMNTARLCRHQGKVKQARELLAPVYGWFTEGFDTRSERGQGAAGRTGISGGRDRLLHLLDTGRRKVTEFRHCHDVAKKDAGGQFRESPEWREFLDGDGPAMPMRRILASLIVVPLTMVVCLCALLPGGAQAQSTGTPQRGVAVLDFNYIDTSGETNSRMVEHQEWLGALVAGLRADFACSTGTYRLNCSRLPSGAMRGRTLRSMSFRARRKRRSSSSWAPCTSKAPSFNGPRSLPLTSTPTRSSLTSCSRFAATAPKRGGRRNNSWRAIFWRRPLRSRPAAINPRPASSSRSSISSCSTSAPALRS